MSTSPQMPTPSVAATQFPVTSRYNGIPTATIVGVDGQTIIYLTRRIVPSPSRFAVLQIHIVTQGERLDNIAAQYLGDPTAFWRLCDANNAMRPDELTETLGRGLLITLPEGISLPTNA